MNEKRETLRIVLDSVAEETIERLRNKYAADILRLAAEEAPVTSGQISVTAADLEHSDQRLRASGGTGRESRMDPSAYTWRTEREDYSSALGVFTLVGTSAIVVSGLVLFAILAPRIIHDPVALVASTVGVLGIAFALFGTAGSVAVRPTRVRMSLDSARPDLVPPATIGSNIDDEGATRFREWIEGRTTIGRSELILVNLRKYAFSVITVLLVVSSFLGFALGGNGVGSSAFIATAFLIAALFSVDLYQSIVQSATVERVLDLEVMMPIRMTRATDHSSHETKSTAVVLGFYPALEVVAGVLGVVAAALHGNLIVLVATVGVVVAVLTTMLGYWRYVVARAMMYQRKTRLWPEAMQTGFTDWPDSAGP